jgi:putative transposase
VAFAASIVVRLRHGVTHQRLHLHAFETGSEARAGIGRWTSSHNADRPPSALGGQTPDKAHAGPAIVDAAA